jgi:lysophospholipid acyltransferase (LPLAT)-like uncharacterized protein
MRLHPAAGPFARGAGRLFALWLRSLRVRVQLPDGASIRLADYAAGNSLFAFSERDLLAVACAAEGRSPIVLVDEGADGDWAVALASALGCEFVRGSSLHHGLSAIRALIGALEATDHPAAIVVDGPVGPAGEAKPGIAFCAAQTGRSIVPVAAAARWRLRFRRSWAGHYLPLPWSRVAIAVGEPFAVHRGASRPEIDAVATTITIRLRELRARALHDLEAQTMPMESTAA